MPMIRAKSATITMTDPDTGKSISIPSVFTEFPKRVCDRLVSQGASIEDALANLREATELCLEEFPLGEVERPILTTFEIPAHA